MQKKENHKLVSSILSNPVSTHLSVAFLYCPITDCRTEKNPFGSYENNTLLSANAEWNSDNNKASCSHIIYHCLSHILYVTIHTISAPTHVEYTIKSEYISN